MIGATLVLALGATLLAVFRLSGSPAGADGVVWIGVWLVAIGCGMQLGAILEEVPAAPIWRVVFKTATWAILVAATAWAVYLAPDGILLIGLLIVPPLIGIAGMVAGERDRPATLGFLLVAIVGSAVHIPTAFERLG